jgi:adenylate kinase
MKLVFLGPPNAGKGTYGDRLIKKHNLQKISTGDLFREHIKNKTKLGIEADKHISQGHLVPDELTIEMLKKAIENVDDFVLDGFPRTIKQAEELDKAIKIDKVFNFTASEKVLLGRASGRRICPKCNTIYHIRNIPPKIAGICDKDRERLIQRDDDKLEFAKKRLEIYEKSTKPLIEYYKKKGILIAINTEKPIDEIVKKIEKELTTI